MSQTKIEKLTPEQEALMPFYREKWRAIALSTTPINREKASAAVKAAYAAMGKREPEIIFLSSPSAVKEILAQQSPQQLAQQLGAPLLSSLPAQLSDRLKDRVQEQLWEKLQAESSNDQLSLLMFILQDPAIEQHGELLGQLWGEWQDGLLMQMWEQQQADLREQLLKQPGGQLLAQIGDFLWTQLGEPLWKQLEETLWKPLANQPLMQTFLHVMGGAGLVSSVGRNVQAYSTDLIDFCISVLNCTIDRRKWEAFQSLAQECGWVIQFEKTCIVCDRPSKLHFDNEQRLHGEGEPAMEFADGYSLYAYRGVRLPEKYGKLHPHQWQAQWLLSESNAELRRVLIQGIGYGRICSELQATELDSWREYSLLKIDSDVDVEPIYLLKMTCPSTGYIHATRVPPDVRSAKEAIAWVNWGTDPEEFAVET